MILDKNYWRVMNIDVNIIQGRTKLDKADVNIIIDVIRAFSVSFYAFENGVKDIIFVSNEDDAFAEKKNNNNIVLSGEVLGYKIENFDFGNSPYDISNTMLNKKTLVQKTTNGVSVTMDSLDANNVYVTGFVNSYSLVEYIKKLILTSNNKEFKINIIASHPTGDDDFACAEYIKHLILDTYDDIKQLEERTVKRILSSDASQKFLDEKNTDFSILDLIMTLSTKRGDFVIEVMQDLDRIKAVKRSIA